MYNLAGASRGFNRNFSEIIIINYSEIPVISKNVYLCSADVVDVEQRDDSCAIYHLQCNWAGASQGGNRNYSELINQKGATSE